MERRHFLAAVSQVAGIRYTDIAGLDTSFAELFSVEDFYAAGLNRRTAAAAVKALYEFNAAKWENVLEHFDCQAITAGEPGYPTSLINIYAPPLVLYCRGLLNQQERVAVVGTRQGTSYGKQVVETFVPLLVAAKHSVVSGLARGIDTFAHQTTLKLGGHTIAVLGCGLDIYYPRENKLLTLQIIEKGGAICSEYPPGTPPLPHHFPARNRIISGLSRACIVVEGPITSGALITAMHALEQGRDVCAVPGSIFSEQSQGPNHLISQGAIALTHPAVLFETLGIAVASEEISHNAAEERSPLEAIIVTALGGAAFTADELTVVTGRPIASLLATLSALEIAGVVSRVPTGEYICNRPKTF